MLMSTNPSHLTDEDIKKQVAYLRQKREQFNFEEVKASKQPKGKKEALKADAKLEDLGL